MIYQGMYQDSINTLCIAFSYIFAVMETRFSILCNSHTRLDSQKFIESQGG